jgi:hypothetical protein
LFDLDGEAVRPRDVTSRRQREPRGRLSVTRVGSYVVGCAAIGILLRVPMPLFWLLPFAGLGCAVATKSAPLGVSARVALASGVLAQATAIFVTPFSWWLRFAFFAVLIGAVAAMSAWQVRDV